jgi:hypothetical protein
MATALYFHEKLIGRDTKRQVVPALSGLVQISGGRDAEFFGDDADELTLAADPLVSCV